MTSAVDTNVLLDLFLAIEQFEHQSMKWLQEAEEQGPIVICHVVYAELIPAFGDRDALEKALQRLNVVISPIDTAIACEAGLPWRQYRWAVGPRNRILADLLIGAHARSTADAFLTRDRGFYSTYFPELQIPRSFS